MVSTLVHFIEFVILPKSLFADNIVVVTSYILTLVHIKETV